MEANGHCQLSDYQHSLKYLLLCSTQEINSQRFGTTWRWENYDRFFIFGWTIPLSKLAMDNYLQHLTILIMFISTFNNTFLMNF